LAERLKIFPTFPPKKKITRKIMAILGIASNKFRSIKRNFSNVTGGRLARAAPAASSSTMQPCDSQTTLLTEVRLLYHTHLMEISLQTLFPHNSS
jgi:hypothetical protein